MEEIVVCRVCGLDKLRTKDHYKRRLCKDCRRELYSRNREELDVFYARWSRAKRRSKEKGWDFDLTVEYLRELYDEQKGQCALTGVEMDATPIGGDAWTGLQRVCGSNRLSLDRIDSSEGYVQGNVQFVTDIVNRAKQYHSLEEFVEMCRKVVERHG